MAFGIDTALVVPGAFTIGTHHFVNATSAPADIDCVEAHDRRHRPPMGDLGKRPAALIPSEADVTEAAEAVARLVAMAYGTRPLRTAWTPAETAAKPCPRSPAASAPTSYAADFFRRIGLDSLLAAGSSL
ncbi:hypothetical protein [Streptomyces niger]|uniref:hypothetical protein n=1 Tax=Streptomyces niger TaxID=66373 RepID=UPI000ACD4B93|nr:hypothetical protein [Streptomyces niger]